MINPCLKGRTNNIPNLHFEDFLKESESRNLQENDLNAVGLDLGIKIKDNKSSIRLYDQLDNFLFSIVRMHYLYSIVPLKIFYSAFGAEVFRIARTTNSSNKIRTFSKVLLNRLRIRVVIL